MSHPNPTREYGENEYPEFHKPGLKRKKMPSFIHKGKEFKEIRKMSQGINATKEGSIAKSHRRAKEKALSKAK